MICAAELTTELVGQLLHPPGQKMVCAAVEVELFEWIPPVSVIASTDQNDVGLDPNCCWLDDLVKG